MKIKKEKEKEGDKNEGTKDYEYRSKENGKTIQLKINGGDLTNALIYLQYQCLLDVKEHYFSW